MFGPIRGALPDDENSSYHTPVFVGVYQEPESRNRAMEMCHRSMRMVGEDRRQNRRRPVAKRTRLKHQGNMMCQRRLAPDPAHPIQRRQHG